MLLHSLKNSIFFVKFLSALLGIFYRIVENVWIVENVVLFPWLIIVIFLLPWLIVMICFMLLNSLINKVYYFCTFYTSQALLIRENAKNGNF